MSEAREKVTIVRSVPNCDFRSDGSILVKNVRLSYEHVFTAWGKNPTDKKKFSATGILAKATHAEAIKAINEGNVKAQMEAFKARIPSSFLFLRNGDELAKPEYEGAWILKASESIRPTVINRDKTPIAQEDDIVYSGCYVNLLVKPWAQNNTHGKRINANLLAVQFVSDGERFSGVERTDVDEAFEDVSGGVGGAASSDPEDDGLS